MVAKDFEVEDLVWARMKGFPPWPAKIVEPTDLKSSSAKKAQHFVYFFGTHNVAWILDENITPHSEEMIKNSENYKKKPAALQKAIEEIQSESKNAPPKKATPVPEQSQAVPKTPKRPLSKSTPAKKPLAKRRRTSAEEKSTAFDALKDAKDKTPASDDDLEEDSKMPADSEGEQPDPKSKKRGPKKISLLTEEEVSKEDSKPYSDEESGYKSKTKVPKRISITTKKSSLKKKVSVEEPEERSPEFSDQEVEDVFSQQERTVSTSKVAIIPPFSDDSSREVQHKPILNRSIIPRPKTPEMDIETPTDFLIQKKVKPTAKKIGFLGLGMIGRGMVKNLLNSGHSVTIWNRSKERCTDFVRAGANMAETPCDVVAACDIILCCVSDPAVAKKLVFGNCGVLSGLSGCDQSKGYVEMTSIDPTTSQEIAEAISDKGGRYLEAPVVGNRLLSEQGQLVIIAAGDQSLFFDCESCFFATSKNSYFISCDVGAAAKMNLIQSMLTGSVAASLAEAMALLDTCRLNSNDFLEVLELGPQGSPFLIDKCKSMMANDYVPNTALKHQQKDLVLALALGHTQQQPLCMAAAANEIFKRARLLRYSEHDVSAVQVGAKV